MLKMNETSVSVHGCKCERKRERDRGKERERGGREERVEREELFVQISVRLLLSCNLKSCEKGRKRKSERTLA